MTLSFETLKRIAIAAAPLALVGCTERTTSRDVSQARQEVAEQQQELDEARHEALKPAIDEGAVEDVQQEQQDVAEAQADLRETQQKFAATQARDAFSLEGQKLIDEADRQIDALKTRADAEEGAAKDVTHTLINDLQTRRDALSKAIDDMKGEELLRWSDHKDRVTSAMKELSDKLNDVR
jgi:hypothetical protein